MSSKIDRERLKAAIAQGGPVACIKLAAALGYKRQGHLIVNGSDVVGMPSYSLRQSGEVLKAWSKLPEA